MVWLHGVFQLLNLMLRLINIQVLGFPFTFLQLIVFMTVMRMLLKAVVKVLNGGTSGSPYAGIVKQAMTEGNK